MMRLAVFLACCGLSAAATCPVQDIGLEASVDGALAASDCRVRDIDPLFTLSTYVNQFRVTLAARGVLTLRMSSTAFDTYLFLYSATGDLIGLNNDADETTNSRITISLDAGKYVVVASSRSVVTGAYTLTTGFEAPRNCPVGELTVGVTASGSLLATTCRTLDLRLLSTDDRPVDRYRLAVTKRTVLTLDMTSAEFDSYLEFYDSQGKRVARDNDSGGGKNARVLVSLDPDNYVVFAYPYRVATGAYALVAATEAQRPCPIKDIKAGDVVTGTLTDQSCRVLDFVTPPSTDAAYIDPYRLAPVQRAVLTLDMTSQIVDTYLVMTDAKLKPIFENDDIDENTTDSEIVGSVEAGSYLLWATTYDVETGAYSLTTRSDPPRQCPTRDLAKSQTVNGLLQESTCRILDLLVPSQDWTLVDPYRITVDKIGVLSLDYSTTDFSPYLMVLDEKLTSQYELDSFGDSSLSADLLAAPPGNYYVFANTDDNGGAYTLRSSFRDPRACPATTIAAQETQSGKIASTDCTFQDVVPFTDTPVHLNQFQVELAQPGKLSVTVNSKDFAPVVFISDLGNLGAYAGDVNSGHAATAQTGANLNPGRYHILVMSAKDASGSYDITTSFARAGAMGDPSPATRLPRRLPAAQRTRRPLLLQ